MKKKNEDLLRLKSLLTKNKFGADDKFETLFYGDLCGVLNDYFDLSGDPLVNVEKNREVILSASLLTRFPLSR